jgi:hypothetical protein
MNERLSPHPVLLPLGEGTLRQLYSFENYARSVRQRPLSQGERDRVRGDTAVMLAPMRVCGDLSKRLFHKEKWIPAFAGMTL